MKRSGRPCPIYNFTNGKTQKGECICKKCKQKKEKEDPLKTKLIKRRKRKRRNAPDRKEATLVA